MEYLVIAYDGKDPDAKARRLRVREAHLSGVREMKTAGTFINGGAILDDSGEMIGSTLYVDFPTRAALDQWVASDPYVTGGVWVNIEVRPIRLALRS